MKELCKTCEMKKNPKQSNLYTVYNQSNLISLYLRFYNNKFRFLI